MQAFPSDTKDQCIDLPRRVQAVHSYILRLVSDRVSSIWGFPASMPRVPKLNTVGKAGQGGVDDIGHFLCTLWSRGLRAFMER